MKHTFIDEVRIAVRSGDGGAGCVSFRREKCVPFGGPDGGDGGRGGNVTVRADAQLRTLLDYRFRPRQFAGNGRPGEGRQRSGAAGADLLLGVPVGTVVYRVDTGALLGDLSAPGAEVTVARGGRGGKGNEHFKSSTRRAPRIAQEGEPGEQLDVRLELKLLADVGIVGLPNVGKSTLIARISAAKPKIADYPFTTLVPHLGVVSFGDAQEFVVADVPGLIPGAHKGAGLGTRFLRHVERVRWIVHLVTVEPGEDARTPAEDFLAIEREIALHNPSLAALQRVLVLNRVDVTEVREETERLAAFAHQRGLPFFAISAVTGEGIAALVAHLGQALSAAGGARLDDPAG